MADSNYLFPSWKGNRPIIRETAWRIINEAAKACGVEGLIDTYDAKEIWITLLPANEQTKDVAADFWAFSTFDQLTAH